MPAAGLCLRNRNAFGHIPATLSNLFRIENREGAIESPQAGTVTSTPAVSFFTGNRKFCAVNNRRDSLRQREVTPLLRAKLPIEPKVKNPR
jgi:hypothetical protein